MRGISTKRLAEYSGGENCKNDLIAIFNAILLLPIGAFLCLIATPNTHRSSSALANILVPWQRPPAESISNTASYYVLGVMLCFIFAAWGAIYKPFSTGQNISFKMIAFIFSYLVILLAGFSLLCHIVIFNHFNPWPAWLGLFAYFAFLGCYKYMVSKSTTGDHLIGTDEWGEIFRLDLSTKGHVFDLCAASLIVILIWPYSMDALNSTWNVGNEHAVAYLFGPAQLTQVPGNLPNVNFFSQYSIGLPYLFSLLLSNDLAQVISRYLYGISICVVIFCVLYYYLASRLYGSRFWGIVFTLLTMALLANALFWGEPSSAPIRFLLFPVCAIAILKMGLTDIKSIIFLSVLCALSILNNTETGVLTGMAIGTVLVMISTSFLLLSKRLCLLLVGTGLCTGILCLICYGWSALSWSFILGNLKPLFAYGIAGFGNYPLPWFPKHWVWMQCLVLPGLAIVLLAFLYYKNWTNRILSKAEQTLVFCSALGLLLLLKFMNRSFLAIGHVSSAPLIIIMGFYFVVALRLVTKTTHWQQKAVRMGGLAILLSVFSLFLYTFRENSPGREVKYATTWLDFPSIFNRIVGLNSPGKTISLAEQVKSKIPSEDLALIQDFAKSRSEPVWIYGKNDWAYLILADRRPASTVLPMPYILLKQDLDVLRKKFMQEPEYMFVEKESLLPIGWILPRFDERYKLIRSGRNLDAYKKR